VVKSGDPVEQEKQLKYASLVANGVMLSNFVDLTDVLSTMAKDGQPVTAALAASIGRDSASWTNSPADEASYFSKVRSNPLTRSLRLSCIA
jgi:hypothetical protein